MSVNEKKNRVTIYEVAKKSGVSLATVSRVMNNSTSVSEKTKEKVNKVIKELGFQPSNIAQGLAKSKTASIAVVIPSSNYVYVSNFLYGIQLIAKEKGLNIITFTTFHSKKDAINVIEEVIRAHVDGAIIFDDELTSDDIRNINSYDVPAIIVNHTFEGDKSGCVLFNHEEIIKKIVLDNYYHNGKPMNFIHFHNGGRLLKRVEKSFIDICENQKIPYKILNSDDSYLKTYEYFKDYFKSNTSGYFIVYRDSLAAAISNAALDSGLRIPQDIEILSIVGTKYSHILRPQISSFDIDFIDVGKKAMNMLSDLIDHNLTDKVSKFFVKYIKRDTTIE